MALIKCEDCGAEISDRAAACIHCGAPIAKPFHDEGAENVQPQAARFADYAPEILAIAFALVGGIIGFIARPSVPILGQLPFGVVIQDGAGLTGLDSLLQPIAHQSFHLLIGGVVAGAILGFLTGLSIRNRR